jgi:hypothetical protein
MRFPHDFDDPGDGVFLCPVSGEFVKSEATVPSYAKATEGKRGWYPLRPTPEGPCKFSRLFSEIYKGFFCGKIFMKESIVAMIRNIFSREITAGEAMVSFEHKKDCPAFGMDPLGSAEYLQIGVKKEWVSGSDGGWGMSTGGFVNVTYIQCISCEVKKVFQEK